MKNLRNSNGITLVALVVTIVVLLILTSISINILTGDNGFITKAKEIRSNIEKAEAEGQAKINSLQQAEYTEDGAVILNDENAPTINSMEVTNITETSFTVKVTVTETGSGLAKIEYSIDDGEHYITPNYNQAKSYTFEDLKIGFEEYKVKVKATDINNNSSYASKTIEKFKIGDYVNYTYDPASNYVLTSSTCGSSSNPTEGIPQTTGLKWRILNINSDKSIDLVSEKPTSIDVCFSGALGYNNGVYLINDICAKQYSNRSKVITARNLTIEDIESKMNVTGIAARNAYTSGGSVQYGNTKTYTGDYSYYPNLYAQENGSGINTTTLKKDGIGRSDAYYTTPTTETYSQANTSGLTAKQDYYYLASTPSSYFDDSNFYSMVFGTGPCYWLASRYSYCYSTRTGFGLRCVDVFDLNGDGMFYSENGTVNHGYRLRPVVSLSFNLLNYTKDSDGHWNLK